MQTQPVWGAIHWEHLELSSTKDTRKKSVKLLFSSGLYFKIVRV